jgi:hypothetical protein
MTRYEDEDSVTGPECKPYLSVAFVEESSVKFLVGLVEN